MGTPRRTSCIATYGPPSICEKGGMLMWEPETTVEYSRDTPGIPVVLFVILHGSVYPYCRLQQVGTWNAGGHMPFLLSLLGSEDDPCSNFLASRVVFPVVASAVTDPGYSRHQGRSPSRAARARRLCSCGFRGCRGIWGVPAWTRMGW